MGPDENGGIISLLRRALTPQSGTETAAQVGAGMVPGVGEAMDVGEIAVGIADRDPSRIAMGLFGLSVPFVSGAGIKAGAKGIAGLVRRLAADEQERIIRNVRFITGRNMDTGEGFRRSLETQRGMINAPGFWTQAMRSLTGRETLTGMSRKSMDEMAKEWNRLYGAKYDDPYLRAMRNPFTWDGGADVARNNIVNGERIYSPEQLRRQAVNETRPITPEQIERELLYDPDLEQVPFDGQYTRHLDDLRDWDEALESGRSTAQVHLDRYEARARSARRSQRDDELSRRISEREMENSFMHQIHRRFLESGRPSVFGDRPSARAPERFLQSAMYDREYILPRRINHEGIGAFLRGERDPRLR